MTENEAINVLKMVEAHGCLVIEAKIMAIQALSEIQQYRAIGTVEEIKTLKVENAELHCEIQAINATMDLLENEIRAKAIDGYMYKLCEHCIEQPNECWKLECPFCGDGCDIVNIAEQLKAGGKNE